MALAFHPISPPGDDYGGVRANGMWYEPWQAGFQDILKRGFPKPSDPRAVLAELHSPSVPSLLHGATASVPFLVTQTTRDVLEAAGLTGFSFAPVVVAKLATRGKVSRHSSSGEPEDVILKARSVSLDLAPTLYAVYAEGMVDVSPDHQGGRHPSGYVSPFELLGDADQFDLWRPRLNMKPFSAWVFCSDRFRTVCEEHALTNIAFEAFAAFMARFRESLVTR